MPLSRGLVFLGFSFKTHLTSLTDSTFSNDKWLQSKMHYVRPYLRNLSVNPVLFLKRKGSKYVIRLNRAATKTDVKSFDLINNSVKRMIEYLLIIIRFTVVK